MKDEKEIARTARARIRVNSDCARCGIRGCWFAKGSIEQFSCIVRYLIQKADAARLAAGGRKEGRG